MDTIISILAIVAGVIGIAGSILPGLPGTPVSWIGLLILYIWGSGTNGAGQALKAAIGSFLGFITGTGLKTIVAVLIMWRIFVFAF